MDLFERKYSPMLHPRDQLIDTARCVQPTVLFISARFSKAKLNLRIAYRLLFLVPTLVLSTGIQHGVKDDRKGDASLQVRKRPEACTEGVKGCSIRVTTVGNNAVTIEVLHELFLAEPRWLSRHHILESLEFRGQSLHWLFQEGKLRPHYREEYDYNR